jgi:polar amino acid transport system substrate-binding protein
MKKTGSLLSIILALAFVCGCVQTTGKGAVASSATSTLDRISQRNLLVVGTAASMPPLNMTTKDGDIIGMEPDLAQRMAEEMGVKVEFKTMPFAELLPALEAGKVDVVLSDITITGKRNMKVAFVGPYFISGKTFLTTEKWAASAKEPEEVNSPNTRLAALKGSTSQQFVEETFPKATLLPTEDYDGAVKMVLDGKADAMIADYPICLLSVIRYPNHNLFSVVPPYTYEPIGIAIQKNDPLFTNWLENFLNTLSGSGELKQLRDNWFENSRWIEKLP